MEFDIMDLTDSPLTLDEITQINKQRCIKWHPGFPNDNTWNLADWSNAMQGESGEAGNIVKKIRRIQTGYSTFDNPTLEQLTVKLGDELADTYLYMDLLATKAGIYLPLAIAKKFNRVSERQGFPERIRITSN